MQSDNVQTVGLAPLVGVVAVLVCLSFASGYGALVTAAPSTDEPDYSGPPTDGPDHGLENTTFWRLWSGDRDNATETGTNVTLDSRNDTARALYKSTDVPFERPPAVVGRWNRGDHGDFTHGNATTSVYPSGVNRSDGLFIKDAYVRVFAIQPSTVVHYNDSTPLYVAGDGEVRGILDYRVRLPPNESTGTTRSRWTLIDTGVRSVRLRTNGTVVASTSNTHGPVLAYRNLSGRVRLDVNATLTATIRYEVLSCPGPEAPTSTCEVARRQRIDRSLRVNTTRAVVVNDLQNASGYRLAFPATGGKGAVVAAQQPWTRIRFDGDSHSTIRSGWRFYTVGRPGWGTLVESTASGERYINSSVRPVQTHAVPRTDPSVVDQYGPNGGSGLTIYRTTGPEHPGPELPSRIDIDVAATYRSLNRTVVRAPAARPQLVFGNATVTGLVCGTAMTVDLTPEITIYPTRIDARTERRNRTAVVLNVTVVNGTGVPVRSGDIVVENRSVPLDNRTATVVVRTVRDSIDIEYRPQRWGEAEIGYLESEAHLPPPPWFPAAGYLIDLAVVTALWVLPLGLVLLGLHRASDGSLFGGRGSS